MIELNERHWAVLMALLFGALIFWLIATDPDTGQPAGAPSASLTSS